MTVAPLPTTPSLAWLDAAEAALLLPDDPSMTSPAESRAVITRIARVEAQLAARKLQHIRVIDEADVATAGGATSTGSLLAGDFGGDRAGAARQ